MEIMESSLEFEREERGRMFKKYQD